MANEPTRQPVPCHNCRRSRHKCDRSFPHCLKCTKKGQECLGYGRLLRWEKGVASRGKMAGVVLGGNHHRMRREVSPLPPLTDPLIQDFDADVRQYLFYFASDVCKELVLYDTPEHNLFRQIIPMTQNNPILLHIVIANAALRLSNVNSKAYSPFMTTDGLDYCNSPLNVSRRNLILPEPSKPYNDALAAKYKALSLLQNALINSSSVETDVTLAAVLLFIEFELIESGRDDWACHISGARTIIERLCGPGVWTQTAMSPLRRCLISNCLVFDILGSTTSSARLTPIDDLPNQGLCLLQDAEGNHCSSFPSMLLQLTQCAARLCESDQFRATPDKLFEAIKLLQAAQSFDPITWATSIQSRSPTPDLPHRTHVASGHRAAVCIYLSRVALYLSPDTQLPCNIEAFVIEVVGHLSLIRRTDRLFTATTWPAFIAGAESADLATQDWVARRFQELWEVEPWGTIRGAQGVLQGIWAQKKHHFAAMKKACIFGETREDFNWIRDLKGRGVDWLII